MFKRLLALTILAFQANACVTAISQQDLDSIKSIQIITDIEDTFYINQIGLTVFENDAFQGDISSWKLKDRGISKLIATLPPSAKIVDVSMIKTGTSMSEGWNSFNTDIQSRARAKNADTILVFSRRGFYNSAGGGFWEVKPARGGFGFYNKTLFSKSVMSCPFFSYSLTLYRVEDGKHLSGKSETLCVNQNTVETTLEFDKYSSEVKKLFKATLEKAIDESLAQKAKELFTPAIGP